MIRKHKESTIQGQISLFDFKFDEVKESKNQNIPTVKSHEDKFTGIINLYKLSAARIVKQVCGALLVELEDKTLYFNPDGVNELELKKDMELLPGDEILVVNQDRELNQLQLQKLNNMHVTEYIKRKGDANIIIQQSGKTIAINPKGWILEYLQKPVYHEDEIYITKTLNKNTDLANNITENKSNLSGVNDVGTSFEKDDSVEIKYKGVKHIGKVVRIYNNGETLNVSWDGKQTAFYHKAVKKHMEGSMQNG